MEERMWWSYRRCDRMGGNSNGTLGFFYAPVARTLPPYDAEPE